MTGSRAHLATRLALGLFACLIAGTLAARAEVKPFWHDEIYTIVGAQLPSFRVLWHADREGLDLAPPLNTAVTMAVLKLARPGRVAVRLPAIAGFLCAAWAAFEIVRRRAGAMSGLCAVLVLCFTAALRFADEARGYGLMLGCFGLALYGWSEAAHGRRRRVHLPLLAGSLAAGCWAQYFGAIAFAPIAAGEAVRSIERRSLDLPIWAALAAGAGAVLPLLPLIHTAEAQAGTFWAHATLRALPSLYAFLLEPLIWRPVAYVAAAILVIATAERTLGRTATPRGLPAYEIVAGLTALLIPAIGLLGAAASTGTFADRYALDGALGFAIVIPLLISIVTGGRRVATAILPAVLLYAFLPGAYRSIRQARDPFVNPFDERPTLAADARGTEAVVITGGLMYLQLWYYAPRDLRQHLWYVADPAEALRFTGTDTADRGYQELRRWAAVQAPDYASFTATHSSFLLYGAGSGWISDRLKADGARFDLIGRELGAPIMRVTRAPTTGGTSD